MLLFSEGKSLWQTWSITPYALSEKPALHSSVRQHSPGFHIAAAAAVAVFILSFNLLSPILLSFVLTVLVTLALNPLVLKIRALAGGRRLAAGIVTVVFVIAMGLTIWAFITPIRTSTTKLIQRVPEYLEQVQRPLIRMEKQAAVSEAKLEKEVTNEVAREAASKGEAQNANEALAKRSPDNAAPSTSVRSGIMGILQGALGGFKSVAYSTAEMFLVMITVFFGTVFTLMHPRPVFASIFSLVPEEHHQKALRIFRRIAEFVPYWALSTLLGMLTIGLLVFLLMWPIFGFMDALILGVIAGVLEAVPYIGPMLSSVPGLLLAFGKGGMTPLWVLLAYVAVQALENNVILPLIMAKGMKLHPVAVIFSMLLCVAAFGVLGVIIAAPVVAIVGILHDELYRKRFLPVTTDEDLEKLARKAMRESVPPA